MRGWRRLGQTCRWLLIGLISLAVMIALLIGIALSSLAHLAKTGRLQVWVSQIFHTPVNFRYDGLSWSGWQPNIVLKEVNILTPKGHPLFHIQSLNMDLDLFRSLQHFSPVLSQLEVTGAEINVVHTRQGTWSLYADSFTKPSHNLLSWQQIVSWLELQSKIQLHQIDFHIHSQTLVDNQVDLQVTQLNWIRSAAEMTALQSDVIYKQSLANSVKSKVYPFVVKAQYTGSLLSLADVAAKLQVSSPLNQQFHLAADLVPAKFGLKLKLEANHLPISTWFSARAILPSEQLPVFAWLATNATGDIKQLRLLMNNKEGWQLTKFSAAFCNLALPASVQYPGVEGLHFQLSISPEHFQIELPQQEIALLTPTNRHQPVQKVKVKLSLQDVRVANQWLLEPKLELQGLGITLNGQGQVAVPIKDGWPYWTESSLNLSGKLIAQQIQAQLLALWSSFLPNRSPTLSWLCQHELNVPNIQADWRIQHQMAKPKEWPNDVRIKGRLDDALLKPLTDWPWVKSINSEFAYRQKQLSFNILHAQAHDITFTNSQLKFSPLFGDTELHLLLPLDTTPQVAIQFMRFTPLQNSLGKLFDTLKLSDGRLLGQVEVMQNLVDRKAQPHIISKLDFRQVRAAWSALPAYPIAHLTGVLQIDNGKMNASTPFQGQWLGQALSFTIQAAPNFEWPQISGQLGKHYFFQYTPESNKVNLKLDAPVAQGQCSLSLTAPSNLACAMQKIDLDQLPTFTIKADTNEIRNFDAWPNVSFMSDQVLFKQQALGKLQFGWQKKFDKLVLEPGQFTGPYFSMVFSGEADTTADHRLQVGINWSVKSQNWGQVFALFGFNQVLQKGEGTVDGLLTWQGHILPKPEDLLGRTQIQLENGVLPSLNPGVAKLLGILSIDGIFRRLSMNFSDLADKGLAFDRLSGTLFLSHHSLSSDKITMSGPAMDLLFSGETELNTARLNLKVTVLPHIGGSMAVAATVVGGPIAGAMTWLADKLLSHTILKDKGLVYYIGGTWQQPDVKTVQ